MEGRIGETLVRRGVVDAPALARALRHQQEHGGRVGGAVCALGLSSERAVCESLAEHLGLPAVVLSESVIPRSAVALLPMAVCRAEGFMAVAHDSMTVTVAFGCPPTTRLMTEMSFATALRVVPVLAVDASLHEMLGRFAADASISVLKGAAVSPQIPPPVAGHLVVVRPPELLRAVDADLHSLDASHAAVTPTAAAAPASAPDARRRVLIVDDIAELRMMIGRALQTDGYLLAEASTGQEAVQQIQTFNPELVVLDAMLPDLHGFEICRGLKQSPTHRHIPVIMMSALYKGWEYARDIQETYGADLFLEKPFDLNFLRERVRVLLAGSPQRPNGEADPSRNARRFVDEAQTLMEMGDLAGAERVCEDGLRNHPFDAPLHALRGSIYARGGHVQHAIVSYERSLEFNAAAFATLKNLAILYEQNGFRRRAHATWQRAYEVCPDAAFKQRIKTMLMMGLQGAG